LRILDGGQSKGIKRILVGIDIGIGELLMADQLAQKGKGFDLVIAHHLRGITLVGLYNVMSVKMDHLVNLGLQRKIAKDLMRKRIGGVVCSLHSVNYNLDVDAAKLLNIPFMCCHLPVGNYVARYLQKCVNLKKTKTLKQFVDLLMKETEYRHSAAFKAGPETLIGKAKDMAGGTYYE